MKQIKLLSFLVATGCVFSIHASAQTPTGKLALKKGQKLEINNEVKSLTTTEMMGQSMEVNLSATTTSEAEVKDKKENSYLLNSTLKRMKINATGPEMIMPQPINFDSDKKEDMEGDMGKGLKDNINVPKEIEIDNNAVLIPGAKKPAAQTDSAAPAGPDMMSMMKSMTGAEVDESNGATNAFSIVPAGKKSGDTWADSTITDDNKVRRLYTLKEIKGNDAIVSLSGTQSTSKKTQQMGMDITVTMESKLSGEATIDIKTGVAKQKTYIVDGTGSTEVMGQSIPMTTKVTTTTTVKSL